jgi:hypothetical protein
MAIFDGDTFEPKPAISRNGADSPSAVVPFTDKDTLEFARTFPSKGRTVPCPWMTTSVSIRT